MTTEKATKEAAKYRDRPNGDKFCSKCTMFRAPDSCTSVKGDISSRGWCEFYKASRAAQRYANG